MGRSNRSGAGRPRRRDAHARIPKLLLTTGCALLAPGCGADRPSASAGDAPAAVTPDPVDPRCALGAAPDTLLRDGETILLLWTVPARPVFDEAVLPADPGLLAYRAAVRADGGDLRRPVADEPTPRDDAEAAAWADERHNHDLAQAGAVGAIEPITCLDALAFSIQNARFPQLETPTEFLVSVLERANGTDSAEVGLVFGASDQTYPPKTVYGFDVVDSLRSLGWRWRYALHNHTLQENAGKRALGSPTLSISDVQLMRGLAADGMEAARVTNGFYTFRVDPEGMERMRSR